MLKKTKVGVLGLGAISDIYLSNIVNKFPFILEIAALSDLNRELAYAKADKHGLSEKLICTPQEMYDNPEIDIILNLTNISVHYQVITEILQAGKHCYSEKPLALNREEAGKLVDLAESKGLRLGCAPDTFMGASHQMARKLIDDGFIGKPFMAHAMLHKYSHSPMYKTTKYGGTQFDMGPYYITALVNMLGPAKSVTGYAKILIGKSMVENTATPFFGMEDKPDVPTLVSGVITFESGALATMTTATDAHTYTSRLEVTGTEGTVFCGDPNDFDGEVRLGLRWQDPVPLPIAHDFADNARGAGLAEMACGIRQNREHRANGRLALHVVDILQAMNESKGREICMTTTCTKPKALRTGRGICSIYDKED